MIDFDKIASDLLDAVGSFGKTPNTISILSAGLSVAFDVGAASVAPTKTKAPVASVAPAAPTDAELLAAQTAAAIVAAT